MIFIFGRRGITSLPVKQSPSHGIGKIGKGCFNCHRNTLTAGDLCSKSRFTNSLLLTRTSFPNHIIRCIREFRIHNTWRGFPFWHLLTCLHYDSTPQDEPSLVRRCSEYHSRVRWRTLAAVLLGAAWVDMVSVPVLPDTAPTMMGWKV